MASQLALEMPYEQPELFLSLSYAKKFNSEPQWLLVLLDDLIKRGKIDRCEATKVHAIKLAMIAKQTHKILFFVWRDEQITIVNL